MKSSTLANRSRTAILAVCSAMVMGATVGVVNAQHGDTTSSHGSSSSQSGTAGTATSQANPKDSSGVAGHGILDKGMESGQVDQKIRVERNKGAESSVPRNKKGKVTEDPSNMQGGSIGPN